MLGIFVLDLIYEKILMIMIYFNDKKMNDKYVNDIYIYDMIFFSLIIFQSYVISPLQVKNTNPITLYISPYAFKEF